MHKVKLPNVSVDPIPGYCSKSKSIIGMDIVSLSQDVEDIMYGQLSVRCCHVTFQEFFLNVFFFFIEISTRYSFLVMLQDRQNLMHHRNGFVKNKVGNNVINAVIFENSSETL